MTHKQCCACRKLLGNCRERRKLFSEATRHVAPKFIKALSAHLASPEERVSQLLAADSLDDRVMRVFPSLAIKDVYTVAQRSKDPSHSQLGAPQKRHFPQRKRELQLLVDFHSLVS